MSRIKHATDQTQAVIDSAAYCLKNIDKAAACIEVYIGDNSNPRTFYMTRAELAAFLENEIKTKKQLKKAR